MNSMWLGILITLGVWLIGAIIYSSVSSLIIWLLGKLIRFEVNFRGEVTVLAALVVLEPFFVSYTIDHAFTWDLLHFINYNLPQFVLAFLFLRWINRGGE